MPGFLWTFGIFKAQCNEEVNNRLRNKQLSGAQKVQINLIDHLFEPSSFLLKFKSYLDR
jgi:hypothetical protein